VGASDDRARYRGAPVLLRPVDGPG